MHNIIPQISINCKFI